VANRPADRVAERKVNAASPADLLAVGLARDAEASELILPECRRLLAKYGSIHRLADVTASDLRAVAGLEAFEIDRTMALMELGRRIAVADRGEPTYLGDVHRVIAHLRDLQKEKTEHFVVLLLDSHLNLIRRHTVHIGTVDASLVGTKDIFREAIIAGAASIIVAHNHPSGDPYPSAQDIAVTNDLMTAGEILDLKVNDHIIVGNPDYYSFKRQKLISLV